MPHFDANSASCRVYVRRKGVLSAIGHDLEIGVTHFRIDIDVADPSAAPRIDAEFAADSLRVITAVDGRVPRPQALSARDRATIDRHIAQDVLSAADHPNIGFRSTDVEQRANGFAIRGRLRLHGAERELTVRVERSGEQWFADATIHQPDFGIRPFRAFAGALKLEAEVSVRVELRWSPAAELLTTDRKA